MTPQLEMIGKPVTRRWRRARPHRGGWWEWREDGEREPEKLLLTDGGEEVVSDDEWERATGRDAEDGAFSYNYWEGTETTQDMMPGLWRRCKEEATA